MSNPALIIRRANVSRKGGHWDNDDLDVFDGDRNVGRSSWKLEKAGSGGFRLSSS
jgi:hypothetical protein